MNKKEDHIIFGVHVLDRLHHVPGVQHLFTEYGCNIKTRIGLHEVDNNYCSPNGLIILELIGEQSRIDELAAKLNAIEGVEVQKMTFSH